MMVPLPVSPLVAALILQLPVVVEGLLGIVRAIQSYGMTDEEATARLATLEIDLGMAASKAREIAARITPPTA